MPIRTNTVVITELILVKLAIANIAERCDLFTGDEKDICRWTLDRQIAVDILDKNGITYAMSEEYFDKYVSSYSFYRDL